MRIYGDCQELMSETGRNLWEMGVLNSPKRYQNQNIEGDEDYQTKELICEQYCLVSLDKVEALFTFSQSQKWADAEFKERISGEVLNPGTAWQLRNEVWEQFIDGSDEFDYTYPERMNMVNKDGVTKLESVINLLKKDPDTRKAILDIYGVAFTASNSNNRYKHDFNNIGDLIRIPCSMYYDFLLRKNQKGEPVLNICYHQRSSDFVTHFGNDVYLAFRLMQHVAKEVGVKEGYLYHTIDSLHSYRKDWDKLKSQISY